MDGFITLVVDEFLELLYWCLLVFIQPVLSGLGAVATVPVVAYMFPVSR